MNFYISAKPVADSQILNIIYQYINHINADVWFNSIRICNFLGLEALVVNSKYLIRMSDESEIFILDMTKHVTLGDRSISEKYNINDLQSFDKIINFIKTIR